MTPDPSTTEIETSRRQRAFRITLLSFVVLSVALVGAAIFAFLIFPRSSAGRVKDEAAQAGRPGESFNAADEDYFHDMDGGVQLTADEVKGRNNWIVWSGGNDRFWDVISSKSFGNLDLLKTISSHPSLKGNRENRWAYYGLVNEPCFSKPSNADPQSLWPVARHPRPRLRR